jgi:hypothetical protein
MRSSRTSRYWPEGLRWPAVDTTGVPGIVRASWYASALCFGLFFLVSVLSGGSALGVPAGPPYLVKDHARLIEVSRTAWWFNLLFSWLALCLPAASAWATVPFLNRIRPAGTDERAEALCFTRKVMVVVLAVFGLLLVYAVSRLALISLRGVLS